MHGIILWSQKQWVLLSLQNGVGRGCFFQWLGLVAVSAATSRQSISLQSVSVSSLILCRNVKLVVKDFVEAHHSIQWRIGCSGHCMASINMGCRGWCIYMDGGDCAGRRCVREKTSRLSGSHSPALTVDVIGQAAKL